MSTKSAQNGNPVVPAAAKAPTDRQPSTAARILQLERDVVMLKEALDSAGRILAGMVENQAVQAAMPAIEGRIRGSIQQAYAERGLAGLMGKPAGEQPPTG